MDFRNQKILVAYFSHKGQNYSNGSIIELKKGNTEVVAEMILELTGADLFEIRSVKEYPYEYNACIAEAKDELRVNSRPELANDTDVSPYDVIFLGYPSWWGTMPMPVWTFLESHDLTGKTVLPFCTHEGSGMGDSGKDLQKLAAGANIKKGLAIHGSSAGGAREKLKSWIREV